MKVSQAFLAFYLLFFVLPGHGINAAASCQDVRKNSQLCQALVEESQPYMTAFHFRPPKNWMNDPNGPMYYNGVYHFFYQYNPDGAKFGTMVWAHSVSHDLVNWKHVDPALQPLEPYDAYGCWSGSTTILPGKGPVILYTGGYKDETQVQNLAQPKNLSDPFLVEWVKFPGNPVIKLPNGILKDKFRDPTTAWQGPDGIWRVLVGSEQNEDGLVFLYKSKDFTEWTMYEHPFHSAKTGMWECPDFFPVYLNSTNGVDYSVHSPNVKYVLKVGLAHGAVDTYVLGTYDPVKEIFLPETDFGSSDLRFDYGKFYASKSFFDSSTNRRILWGWVNESEREDDSAKRGWQGLQAVPRKIWFDSTGKQLMQWPINEIEMLRDKEVSITDKELKGGSVLEIPDITASQADVEVSFELPNLEEADIIDPKWVDPGLLCGNQNAAFKGRVGPFGLLAFASEDFTEQTALFFRVFKGKNRYVVLMCTDQSRSSGKSNVDKTPYGAFVHIDPRTEKISLRSLIDHSIVESFVGGGRTCITARVYPLIATGNNAHIYVFNNGTSSVVVSKLSAWSMKKVSIEYNGLTESVDIGCDKDIRYSKLEMYCKDP